MFYLSKISLFIFILIAVYFYLLNYRDRKEKEELNGETTIIKRLNSYIQNREGYFSYERIEKKLKQTGNSFKLTPLGYIAGKFLLIAIFFMLSMLIFDTYVVSIVLSILGFFTLDILIYYKNKKDMQEIRFELKNVYDSLKIQLAAGDFITETLAECYLIVSNKRFKERLAILSAEIAYKHNIEQALDHFLEGFGPKENDIKTFVMTIKQSLNTGKIKKDLESQSKQINKMSMIYLNGETKKVEDTIDGIAILLFIGIFITLMYFAFTLIPSNGVSGFH